MIFSYSKDCNLKRWTILNHEDDLKKYGIYEYGLECMHPSRSKTNINLGYDKNLNRPVIIKTINYSKDDLKSIDTVNKRRDLLVNQLDVLNNISSPLLPEPLDLFLETNSIDLLPSESLKYNEPVLVLEYQPGRTLKETIKSLEVNKESEDIRINQVSRIGKNILYFLTSLHEKNYVHLGLSTEHIIMLKNENIRVLGLSKIYETNKDGYILKDNIMCNKTLGYSAPELYDENNNIFDSRAISAFSLGVILHQMICKNSSIEKYMLTKLDNGSVVFNYPNEVSEAWIRKKFKFNHANKIHDLLCKLCELNPDKRLSDFDKIEAMLTEIGGEKIIPIRKWKCTTKNQIGTIIDKKTDKNKEYFLVRDKKSYEEYILNIYDIDKLQVDKLNIGMTIEYNIYTHIDGHIKIKDIILCSEFEDIEVNTYDEDTENVEKTTETSGDIDTDKSEEENKINSVINTLRKKLGFK